MISVGSPAPDFELQDQFGRRFRLRDHRGRRAVLLLFYPGDFTFTCAREVPAIAALADRFRREANTLVVGISCDSRFVHLAWGADLGGVPTPLLSDCHPQGAVSRAYGAWVARDGTSDRATVIVGCDGVVRYSHSVTPGGERDVDGLLAAAREVAAACPPTRPAPTPPPRHESTPGVVEGILYSQRACGHCRHVLRLLANLRATGIVVRDVADEVALRELQQLTGQAHPPTPTLAMDGRTYTGRNEIEPALVAKYLGEIA